MMQIKSSEAKVKQDRSVWEKEYASGQWSLLRNRQELARYRVVAGYVQAEPRPLSLLDIGCGEGVILRHLNLDRLEHYTGLDVAQAALDNIRPRRPQDTYVCSTLEQFTPDRTWDVVLFNEVLYYTFDPVAHLRQFESALRPGGWFVISMHRKSNPLAVNNRCLRQVRRYLRTAHYEILDAVELRKLPEGTSWQVYQVRPPTAAGPGGSCESR